MNIKRYMLHHEATIKALLLERSPSTDWVRVQKRHRQMLYNMQHERFVHLLVTLAFGVFLLIATGIAMNAPNHQSLALMAMFLIVEIPYVAHYFFLENTIQRWYLHGDAIDALAQEGLSVTELPEAG